MASAAELAAVLRVKDEASADVDHFRGRLDMLENKMGVGIPSAAIAMGVGVTAAIGTLVALGDRAFELGKSFDESFDRITIKTGATGDALASLQDDFRAVVQAVPTDFGKASDAVATLAVRTGQTGEALQELAETELELARLTGADLGEQMRTTTRLFGDWSIATDHQRETLDELLRLSQLTGVGVSDLSQQVVQFGAPMRELGFTFEEAAATVAKFEKEGVNAETVFGTMRLAVAKLAEAGIDPAQGFRDLLITIRDLDDPLAATTLAMDVFGKRGGADMAAAIREGRFAVDDLVKQMEDASGAVKDTAQKTDDAAQSWEKLGGRMATAMEPAGTAIFDLANDLTEKAIPAVELFANDLAAIAKGFDLIAQHKLDWGDILGPLLGNAAKTTLNFGTPQGLLAKLFGIDLGDLTGQALGAAGNKIEDVLGGTALIESGGMTLPVSEVMKNRAAFDDAWAQYQASIAAASADAADDAADIADTAAAAAEGAADKTDPQKLYEFYRHLFGLDKGTKDRLKIEIAQLTTDTFNEAFAGAGIGAGLGPGRSIFDAITKAAIEGGQGNIDALARQAADMRQKFEAELDPDEAAAMTAEFFRRIDAAIKDPTIEARAAVGEFVQAFDVAVQIRELGQKRADAINEATDAAMAAQEKAKALAQQQEDDARAQFAQEQDIASQRAALQKQLKDAQDAVRDRQQGQQFQTQTDRSIEDRDIRRGRDDVDRAERQAKELADVAAKGQDAINAARFKGDTLATLAAMKQVEDQKKAIQARVDAENAAEEKRREREDEDFARSQARRQEDLAQQKAFALEMANDPAIKAVESALDAFNQKLAQDKLDEKIAGYWKAYKAAVDASNENLANTEIRADQQFAAGAARAGAPGGVVQNVTVYNTNNGVQGGDAVEEAVNYVLQAAADSLAALGN